MPNEVKVEFRGSIQEYTQLIREEVPAILTSLARITTRAAAEKSPGGGPSGKVGGSLITLPAMHTGPNRWESGIASNRPKLVWWHEFGTGERKEGGGTKYPIVATKSHRMLVFEKEGVVRFIRGKAGGPAVVRHPGVRATKMIRKAIEAALPPYLHMFNQLGLRVKRL